MFWFWIYRSDVLEPEDVILSIDGTPTSGLRQEQVAGLLRAQPGSVVEIEIEYEMPQPGWSPCHIVFQRNLNSEPHTSSEIPIMSTKY